MTDATTAPDGAAPPAPVATRIAAPAPPRFVSTVQVEDRVALAYPIEYDAKVYDAIRVRMLTIGELAAFMESNGDAPDTGAIFRYPIYFDDAGAPVPIVVLDALAVADHTRVKAAGDRFLSPGPAVGAVS